MAPLPTPAPVASPGYRNLGRCGVCGTWADPGTAWTCPRCDVRTHRDCRDFVECCPTYGCFPPRPHSPRARAAGSGPGPAFRLHSPAAAPGRLESIVAALAWAVRFGVLLAYILAVARAMGALREGGALDLALVVVALAFAGGFASRAAIDSVSGHETSIRGPEWWLRSLFELGLVAAGALVCVPLGLAAVVLAFGVGLAEPLALAWCCTWLWSSAYSLAWD